MALTHFLDMRYGGQAYEIRIPLAVDAGPMIERLASAIAAFHVAHKDQYGYSYEGRELVELVNVGVTGLGLLKRPQIPAAVTGDSAPDAALRDTTEVYFPQSRGKVTCPIYVRALLKAGNLIEGPAIVEQYDSTTVINPGWGGRIDEWGSLVLTKQ
jgi:N-methylhydantoinase A